MPHDREFLGNPVTAGDAFAAVVNVLQCCSDVVHVVVGIDPARDCKPEEFEARITVFLRFRVAVCEQCADFHAPDACFKVKFDCECLRLELFLRDIGKDFLRIDEDCVPAGRPLVRHSVFVQFGSEVSDLFDPCLERRSCRVRPFLRMSGIPRT